MAAAQAAVNLIDVQIGKLSVTSPVAGVVLDRPLNVGEIAAAGAEIVEIGSLDKVNLTVYVPEDQYGQIKLGQKATIQIDSYPGRTFDGRRRIHLRPGRVHPAQRADRRKPQHHGVCHPDRHPQPGPCPQAGHARGRCFLIDPARLPVDCPGGPRSRLLFDLSIRLVGPNFTGKIAIQMVAVPALSR